MYKCSTMKLLLAAIIQSIREDCADLDGTTANADCECGYATNPTNSSHYSLFTDLIESDFQTIQNISLDTDWKLQRYYTDYIPTSGYYEKITRSDNVISNPLKDNATRSGSGILGDDAGLQLCVRGGIPSDGLIPSAEIKTAHNDILYGSFCIAAKLSPINGTCSAFSIRPFPMAGSAAIY
ncbi:conserved hypothetical protein [Paecilomyces variotii No. 5]|uniref:Uncharacterized protein n=1 Tax=Byssochlamys spectabilis (strain No. 5 / NBRC 109023) TaxID=1356009 RepID=V5FF70_BYSSN|nr:conserved hypothetical protein [Paecilomyces variotii No. 5]